MPPYAITNEIPVIRHAAPRRPSSGFPAVPSVNAIAPSINTIRAVKDHAPAEIAELDATIMVLQQRLDTARARKRLLGQLVAIIEDSEPLVAPVMLPPMTLVR